MGTPLGPTFANFYMCSMENKILETDTNLKPTVYCRYVDDTFVVIDNFNQLINLRNAFERESVLKFTYEIENKRNISFLDVSINRTTNNDVSTTVFVKHTNTGDCLNYNSICPDRYKTGVIKNFLHRANNICSTNEAFVKETERIKQVLVNNNFPNKVIDKHFKEFMNKRRRTNIDPDTAIAQSNITNQDTNNRKDKYINVFFRNQMSDKHKIEEREIQKIFKQHIVSNEEGKETKLNIYYKNRKLKNIFIRNSTQNTSNHNVIYEYVCNKEPCNSAHTCYIGHTTVTIKERFKQHASVKQHFQLIHKSNITGSQMLPNVNIINRSNNKNDLKILEALLIKEHNPVINRQVDDFNRTLKIF